MDADTMTVPPRPAPPSVRGDRRAQMVAWAGVFAALGAGLVTATLAAQSHPVVALLAPILLVPVIVWRWPVVGVLTVVAATAVIEQFEYMVSTRNGAATDLIPFFHSITPGSGVTPAEILLAITAVAWIVKSVRCGERLVPRSPVTAVMVVFLVIVLFYLGVGLTRGGGNFKIAIWEMRPWLYIAIMFLLSASLFSSARRIRTALWLLVLGSAFKAAYGVVIWISVRNLNPRPESILAHEESFFFGLYVCLTLALWMFEIRGALRTTATALLPIVLFADLANTRRTAWAILGVGMILVLVVTYVCLPDKRQGVRRAGVVLVFVSALYFPVYWNQTGVLAQPARAVHSLISPDARDSASNEYRVIENANLVLGIRATKDLGSGFGQPINQTIPNVSLTSVDSAIDFIPHDGFLYIWLRTGILGEIVFWLLVAAAMIRACRLTRINDRMTLLVGTLTACALVGYVIMGYEDMGFFWFRIALCVGFFMGTVEARWALHAQEVSATAGPPLRELVHVGG